MPVPSAKVPATLLLAQDLSPAAKLVWMALYLHARSAPARPARLAAAAGLSLPTVLKALAQLVANGWCTAGLGGYLSAFPRPPRSAAQRACAADPAPASARAAASAPPAGPTPAGSPAAPAAAPASALPRSAATTAPPAVARRGAALAILPAALLADRRAGIRGKVLYGLLQLAPGYGRRSVAASLAAVCAMVGACGNTVKRAIRQLTAAGWLLTHQRNRLAPVEFTLEDPAVAHGEAERAKAELRISRIQEKGEALMQEYLTLLIDSDEWENNARPGFLVNPETEARLELDRYYYAAGLAFEYQGAQHDRPTEKISAQEVAEQQVRDLMKLGLCTRRGMPLVAVRWQDLTLATMQRKVRAALEDRKYMLQRQQSQASDGAAASMAEQQARAIPRLRDLTGYEPVIELLETASRRYQDSARAEGQIPAQRPGANLGP